MSAQAPLLSIASSGTRARWLRRARIVAWGAIIWHVAEFAIALAAGLSAGSVALIGFGADSLIEAAAGLVLIWLFSGRSTASDSAEARARRLIAVSFFVLAAYIAFASARSLVLADAPSASVVGIALAAFTTVTMPLLARTKARIARELGSLAAESESKQTMLCAYLSVALLAGLGANAAFGWWWADPLAALAVSGVALREGVAGWRGEASCCAPARSAGGGCDDGCCG